MSLSDRKQNWRSFAGGEVAPELYGRFDLPKYQTGLALCKNFEVLPHGPVRNRAGSQYVVNTKSNAKTRIIPFIRGNGQAMAIGLSAGFIRFYKDGGVVLDPALQKAITGIAYVTGVYDAFLDIYTPPHHVFTVAAHGYSNGTGVRLLSITKNGSPYAAGGLYTVGDATADTFTLQDQSGNYLWTDADPADVFAGGYVIAAVGAEFQVATPYAEEHLFEIRYAQDVDTITFTHPSYAERELTRIADNNWTFGTISFAPTIAAPAGVAAAATVSAGAETVLYSAYKVTCVKADGEESLASAFNAGSPTNAGNRLWNAGNRNTVTWTENADADHYNIYKSVGEAASEGAVYGFIGQSLDKATPYFVDNNIAADTSVSPPLQVSVFGSTNNYPTAVAYYQQRRLFAGTNNDPQRFWATNVGFPKLMTASVSPQDDQAFTYKLSALQANAIRHIVALKNLLMLTGGNVWRVFAATGDSGVTPTNIDAAPDVNVGSTHVRPVVANEKVLYANSKGEHLISIDYSNEAAGYKSQDLSVIASHLIDGKTWVQMDYQQAPHACWWGVRSDGKLIGLTYLPDEQVVAWHQHETDGIIESVAVVPEGVRDVVYLSVKRVIAGATVRFIEFIRDRAFETVEDAYHVDAGLTYDGAAATTISGLTHLAGSAVTVLADGIQRTGLTVSSTGTLTLPTAAAKVHIGLGFTAQLKTLPLTTGVEGNGLTSAQNINGVTLRVKDSLGFTAGPDFDNQREVVPPVADVLSGLAVWRSGKVSIEVDPSWAEDGEVCIEQSAPLPVLISAMAVGYADAGG